MITIPGTQEVSNEAAFYKSLLGSGVVAVLTGDIFHALLHLPITFIKNIILCFKNVFLNLSTDILTCLSFDGFMHTLTEDPSGQIAGALEGGHHHETILGTLDEGVHDLHCDHGEHGDVHGGHGDVHGEPGHDHGEHGHDHGEHGHGPGVAVAASVIEEHKQVISSLKRWRNRLTKSLGFKKDKNT